MTSTTITSPLHDLEAARRRNEATWRASAVALYAGEIEEFLRHWVPFPRYTAAYPVAGVPATVEGREHFLALFGGFAAAAETIAVHDVRFHQTDDPDVVFVEERMTARLHDGSDYDNRMVLRVTFEGDLISEIYEYYGEVAHTELLARLMG